MKLKYNFVINNVAGSVVAVPVGTDSAAFKGYIKLNDTGAYIFKSLKTGASREELIEGILRDFEGAQRQEVEKTVDEFLDKLRASDIITE